MFTERRAARSRRRGGGVENSSRPVGDTHSAVSQVANTVGGRRSRGQQVRPGQQVRGGQQARSNPTQRPATDRSRAPRRAPTEAESMRTQYREVGEGWLQRADRPLPQGASCGARVPREEQDKAAPTSASAFVVKLPLVYITAMMLENSEEDSCCICMEDYHVKERVRLLPCLHRFHANCIGSWTRKHNTCPLCNEVIFRGF